MTIGDDWIGWWNGFISNALSTFIGVIIGIPVAVILSEWQESVSTKERTKKILESLINELMINLMIVDLWSRDTENFEGIVKSNVLLRDELWSTFSNGGEIQWIKDVGLLTELADAYQFIRTLRSLSGRIIDLTEAGEDYTLNRLLLPTLKDQVLDCKRQITSVVGMINGLGIKEDITWPPT